MHFDWCSHNSVALCIVSAQCSEDCGIETRFKFIAEVFNQNEDEFICRLAKTRWRLGAQTKGCGGESNFLL